MMRWLMMIVVVLSFTGLVCGAGPQKPRLVVLTDIGGDPDDQQSMIRLMLYSNEFEIEGLIASAAGVPGELKKDQVRPELIREIVQAYGQVRPNLLLHHPDYPAADHLMERIKAGNPVRGLKSLGEGKDTEGSDWIIRVVDRADERPVNITIWGGSTELAQALTKVSKGRTPEEFKKFVSRIRVYDISHQDDTGAWIVKTYPDLFYVLSKAPDRRDMREGGYRGMYLGGDQSLTSRKWIDAHVRIGHGPLGALYPTRTWTEPNPHGTLKEGDTPSWFYFLPVGLGNSEHPEWGGWGGRFKRISGGLYRDSPDSVDGKIEARATVWRWRPAYQADFEARMDWCVKPFKEANHPPKVVVNGDKTADAVRIKAKAGEAVKLDGAGSSDPDGQKLRHRWWVYSEAGDYAGQVKIDDAGEAAATLHVPADAVGKSLHVILDVMDDGAPALTRYRRVVIECQAGF